MATLNEIRAVLAAKVAADVPGGLRIDPQASIPVPVHTVTLNYPAFSPPPPRPPQQPEPASNPLTQTVNAPRTGDPMSDFNYHFVDPLATPGTSGAVGGAPNPTGGLVDAGCDLIGNPILRAACRAVGNTVFGNQQTAGGTLTSGCPKGYHSDGKGGCAIDGLGTYLPGDVGRQDTGWNPVNGRYGAGVTPILVQRNRRECPSGFVLGTDGICYDHIARTNRAHNPGAKPMLTGGDMNALRRAHQLQKTITKINRRFGKKVCHAPPRGKGKR